jgi:copper(I)-binding protein
MLRRITFVGMLLFVTLFAAGCRPAGELAAIDAWARPGTAGGNSAVYFTIDNPTGEADTLLSAAGDIAGQVELHLSKASSDGVMTMEQQMSVPVTGSSTVIFAPGGLHVMLIGLRQDLKVGDTFPLRLRFEKAGEITLTVSVEDR